MFQHQQKRYTSALLFACTLALPGCSTVMEYNRPDPVYLGKFVPGERRLNVIGELGAPLASEKDEENSCDVYKLYTRGPDGMGKGAIAATEAVAGVLTLGLSEIVATPLEAGTKNSLHTVIFCYTPDNKLLWIKEDGSPLRELAQDRAERDRGNKAAGKKAKPAAPAKLDNAQTDASVPETKISAPSGELPSTTGDTLFPEATRGGK